MRRLFVAVMLPTRGARWIGARRPHGPTRISAYWVRALGEPRGLVQRT